ncbi:hypothetical protein RDV64_13530 [Acuticoccus sp. MNP-M23]|uniref:hypothetical protein n=1 Tax=Acuticoccus sp. MNP-M23 TaxID=3072793 RepID=UPI0028153ADB|nr:hypothetical protein [Acuticoccus sp. MNP-M23]WMS41102.1 hypothetical protein RDV64_13530 [Acuticoccus sp. MNP-M23]
MSLHADTDRTAARSIPHTDAVRLLLDIVTGTRRIAPVPAAGGSASHTPAMARRSAVPAPEPTPREIRALIRDEIIPAAVVPHAPRCVAAEACPVAPVSRKTGCDARCAAASAADDRVVDADWEHA